MANAEPAARTTKIWLGKENDKTGMRARARAHASAPGERERTLAMQRCIRYSRDNEKSPFMQNSFRLRRSSSSSNRRRRRRTATPATGFPGWLAGWLAGLPVLFPFFSAISRTLTTRQLCLTLRRAAALLNGIVCSSASSSSTSTHERAHTKLSAQAM